MKGFKKFLMRGNVMDLAVAVIIGGAFGKIVSSFVNDVIMPVIGVLLGKVNFTDLKILVTPAQGDAAEVAIYYGRFIQNIVDFVIIAAVIYAMIKTMEKFKKKEEKPAEPPKPSDEVVLLTEIRDLLRQQK